MLCHICAVWSCCCIFLAECLLLLLRCVCCSFIILHVVYIVLRLLFVFTPGLCITAALQVALGCLCFAAPLCYVTSALFGLAAAFCSLNVCCCSCAVWRSCVQRRAPLISGTCLQTPHNTCNISHVQHSLTGGMDGEGEQYFGTRGLDKAFVFTCKKIEGCKTGLGRHQCD